MQNNILLPKEIASTITDTASNIEQMEQYWQIVKDTNWRATKLKSNIKIYIKGYSKYLKRVYYHDIYVNRFYFNLLRDSNKPIYRVLTKQEAYNEGLIEFIKEPEQKIKEEQQPDEQKEQQLIAQLSCISPIDGRYYNKTKELRPYFSEYGFFSYRLNVEISYLYNLLSMLMSEGYIEQGNIFDIKKIATEFSMEECVKIKKIEKKYFKFFIFILLSNI